MLLVALAAPAPAMELDPADRAAAFAAAGFTPRGDQFVRCDDTVAASSMPGWIEAADLNQDGSPEAWVKESSLYCYGNIAEAFVLVGKDADGGWTTRFDVIAQSLEEMLNDGWRIGSATVTMGFAASILDNDERHAPCLVANDPADGFGAAIGDCRRLDRGTRSAFQSENPLPDATLGARLP